MERAPEAELFSAVCYVGVPDPGWPKSLCAAPATCAFPAGQVLLVRVWVWV